MNKESTIRGLSLTRPWPYAFLLPPSPRGVPAKLVENRSWPPPPWLVGHYLALHAAKSWDEEDREFIADVTGLYVPDKTESAQSVIFAVCKLVAHVESASDPLMPPVQRPWFFGPFGWLLDDFVALKTPVPCKGGQRLWTFNERPRELAALREAYREARA